VLEPRTQSRANGGAVATRSRRGGCLYSPDVNAEFNWWLLIVGLVVGAGLVWLVVADSRRREVDVSEAERAGEARWIAEAMTDAGRGVDDEDVLDILRLHAAYLAATPPDETFEGPADDVGGDARWVAVRGATGPAPSGTERRPMAHPIDAEPAGARDAARDAGGMAPVRPLPLGRVDGSDRKGGPA
jgi:hypothetical protein